MYRMLVGGRTGDQMKHQVSKAIRACQKVTDKYSMKLGKSGDSSSHLQESLQNEKQQMLIIRFNNKNPKPRPLLCITSDSSSVAWE